MPTINNEFYGQQSPLLFQAKYRMIEYVLIGVRNAKYKAKVFPSWFQYIDMDYKANKANE